MRLACRAALKVFMAVALATGALHAGTAEDLADVARFFPAGTEGFLYFKSPGAVKGLFRGSLFVSAERVEKHLEDAYGKFGAATGFHPFKDSDWLVMNVTWPEPGKAQNPLLFIHGNFNPPKLLPVLEKDPLMTSGGLTKEMVEGRPLYSAANGGAAGFATDTLLVLGDTAPVKAALQTKKDAKPSFDMTNALRGFDTSARVGVSVDLTGLAGRIPAQAGNPAASAILSKMVRLVVNLTEAKLGIGIEFHDDQEAKASADMLGGIKEFAKSYFAMQVARFQTSDPSSVLGLVTPEAVYSRVVSEAMTEFLTALSVTPAGRVMTVEAPRERLPFLDGGDGPLALAVAGAAVAIPNFVKGRDVAARTACHQNQRILQAAVEHFRSKNKSKQKAALEEIVEKLVADGTLSLKPEDPGEGKDSFKNYKLADDGKVSCAKHGSETDSQEAPSGLPGVPAGLLNVPGLNAAPAIPAAPEAPEAAPESKTDPADAKKTDDAPDAKKADDPPATKAGDGDEDDEDDTGSAAPKPAAGKAKSKSKSKKP